MRRLWLLFASLPPLLALRLAVVYAAKQLLNRQASINYSQTGEDAVIRSLLDETTPGFYIDVGCHHPIRASNTLSLYLHGWRGLNIDANPRLVARFREVRRRDVAVCAAISDREQEQVFHVFDDELVSTLATEVLPEWQGKWTKQGERTVTTRRLDSVLDEQRLDGTEIGLLSVDVEGHDLNVLRSIDLDRYRPKLIVVEMHHLDLHRVREHPVTRHLEAQQFRQVGYDTLNGYFADVRTPRAGLRLG